MAKIKKNNLFRVLEWKDQKVANAFGRYAIPMKVEGEVIEFCGCEIPDLMTTKATINGLKQIYPTLDFNEVVLKTIKITEVK